MKPKIRFSTASCKFTVDPHQKMFICPGPLTAISQCFDMITEMTEPPTAVERTLCSFNKPSTMQSTSAETFWRCGASFYSVTPNVRVAIPINLSLICLSVSRGWVCRCVGEHPEEQQVCIRLAFG